MCKLGWVGVREHSGNLLIPDLTSQFLALGNFHSNGQGVPKDQRRVLWWL